jgi:hypothetical protein
MTKPKDIDWDGVELAYRPGIKTLAVIGEEFGISDAAIVKRAKKYGWTRDLKERIRAETEKRLAELVSPEKLVKEELVIEANANLQTSVVVSHRKDIGQARNLGGKLFAEVEAVTDNRELFDKLGELMYAPDDKGRDKLNEIYQKVISMPGRVSSYKALTDAIKTMIGLERQAYGLADNANGEANSEQKAEISDTEAARRIAFVFASAMHKKGE